MTLSLPVGSALRRLLLLCLCAVLSGAALNGSAVAGPGAPSAQETVRNGDFSQGESGWGKVGSLTGVTANGNPGNGMRVWPSVLDTNNISYVLQQIHLPTTTTGVSFDYSYRFSAEGSSLAFGSYAAAIYTDLNQAPIVTLHQITDAGSIDANWHTAPKTLSASEVAALQNASAAGQPLYLVVFLQATDLSVTVDNISLMVDGAMSYPTVAGAIAFLGHNNSNNNTTVNRVQPDGSGRQTLWTHPDTIDPDIYDVRWKPNATEIAFTSDHEFAYSAFHADIYGIDSNGGNLRRISNPPQKSSWPNGRATGTITGKIANQGPSFPSPFLIYVQGAKEPVSVSMPAFGGEATFTVPDVEDLGVGVSHFAVFNWSGGSNCANGKEYEIAIGDVQAGQTVDVGTLTFNGLCNSYNANHLTWKGDGSQIGFLLAGVPQKVMSSGEAIGTSLFNSTHFSNGDTDWSPQDDRILYSRWRENTTNNTIFLTTAGGATGTQLSIDNQNDHENPVWLPDGTGFLFTYNNGQAIGKHTLQGSQSQVLYTLYSERADNPSVSPDGKYLVYERQNVDGSRRDLWVMNISKPNEQWAITSDGRSGNPDWSRTNPGSQSASIYLPQIVK